VRQKKSWDASQEARHYRASPLKLKPSGEARGAIREASSADPDVTKMAGYAFAQPALRADAFENGKNK